MNLLITGAGKGIGLEATAFALEQKHHVIAISRQVQKLEILQIQYPHLQILALDLTDTQALESILPTLQNAGKIDALIHNAGLLINKPFLDLTDEDWAQSWELNIMAVVRLTRLCLPFMGRQEKGHIVNVGSMGGFQGSSKFGGLASYSTSKGALTTLTECLAVELLPHNIHVNCLCLGAVQTEMLQQAFPDYKAPLTAEQMGKYLIQFATEHTPFYNGKILPVAVSVP
jgi:short-subunit dehydrogenase